MTRDAVIELGRPDEARAARARFVSEALRPAETTEHWQSYRSATSDAEIEAALADVAFIEAADEREEALALAIGMREILEEPDKTAALVTPDRNLARRVAAELTRFGIDVEDSAGEPLSASPYGILARLVALCAGNGLAGEDVVALLAHPLAHFGSAESRDRKARAAFRDRPFTPGSQLYVLSHCAGRHGRGAAQGLGSFCTSGAKADHGRRIGRSSRISLRGSRMRWRRSAPWMARMIFAHMISAHMISGPGSKRIAKRSIA